MRDLSPVSFVDDGLDFDTRAPATSSWDVIQWNDAIGDSASTIGPAPSYFDDGADLLPSASAAPGFGKPDAKFYEQPRRKRGSTDYNAGFRKAVEGDVRGTLKQIKQAGKIQSTARGRAGKKEQEKREKEPDSVKVKLPKRQPTYVIHGEDGRVVVVDNEGDVIDSGPLGLPKPPPPPRPPRRMRGEQTEAKSPGKDGAKEPNGGNEGVRDKLDGPPDQESSEGKSKQDDNQHKGKAKDQQEASTQPARDASFANPWTTYLETHDAAPVHKARTADSAPGTRKKGREREGEGRDKSDGKRKEEMDD